MHRRPFQSKSFNSTGDAPALAEELRTSLTALLPYTADIRLQPTNHAGHAVQLAREAAAAGGDILVVSVSGDGGYNEVVNGVMEAGNPDAVCAVMAAGNANDHRRTTGTAPLEQAIAAGRVRRMDLLRIITGEPGDAPLERNVRGVLMAGPSCCRCGPGCRGPAAGPARQRVRPG